MSNTAKKLSNLFHCFKVSWTDCDESVEKDLQWLPFNTVQNWSSNALPKAQHMTTWFPSDDNPLFHGPPEDSRPPLTYAGLHDEIEVCPRYDAHHVVAVLLPPAMLAEMAVVLVSFFSQPTLTVAPLDPNMSHPKLVVALKQLECTALVTTSGILQRSKMLLNCVPCFRRSLIFVLLYQMTGQ